MTDRKRREFPEFVAARGAALQRAAYLMVGDTTLAQDLVQEALTKTYVAWPRLHDLSNAGAYTRRVITTTAITWFRRKGWNAERTTDRPPERVTADHADDVAVGTALWGALEELPPRQRVAVVLRFYDDLTEVQTAAAMGCAVGTVKSQVSAALAKLRARLGDDLRIEVTRWPRTCRPCSASGRAPRRWRRSTSTPSPGTRRSDQLVRRTRHPRRRPHDRPGRPRRDPLRPPDHLLRRDGDRVRLRGPARLRLVDARRRGHDGRDH